MSPYFPIVINPINLVLLTINIYHNFNLFINLFYNSIKPLFTIFYLYFHNFLLQILNYQLLRLLNDSLSIFYLYYITATSKSLDIPILNSNSFYSNLYFMHILCFNSYIYSNTLMSPYFPIVINPINLRLEQYFAIYSYKPSNYLASHPFFAILLSKNTLLI